MWHDVVWALFPGLPSDLSGSSYLTSEEELIAAGLGPYLKKCLTVTGGGCCVDAPVNLKLLLGKLLSFVDEQGHFFFRLLLLFNVLVFFSDDISRLPSEQTILSAIKEKNSWYWSVLVKQNWGELWLPSNNWAFMIITTYIVVVTLIEFLTFKGYIDQRTSSVF